MSVMYVSVPEAFEDIGNPIGVMNLVLNVRLVACNLQQWQ